MVYNNFFLLPQTNYNKTVVIFNFNRRRYDFVKNKRNFNKILKNLGQNIIVEKKFFLCETNHTKQYSVLFFIFILFYSSLY